MSWNWRRGDRPSFWESWVKICGFDSRGMTCFGMIIRRVVVCLIWMEWMMMEGGWI